METLKTNFKLSVFWLFVLMNIIFRDIHQFKLKSHWETLLAGVYESSEITEKLTLLGGFPVEYRIK